MLLLAGRGVIRGQDVAEGGGTARTGGRRPGRETVCGRSSPALGCRSDHSLRGHWGRWVNALASGGCKYQLGV